MKRAFVSRTLVVVTYGLAAFSVLASEPVATVRRLPPETTVFMTIPNVSEFKIRTQKTSFGRMLAETEGMDLMCAIATAQGQPPHDIISRVFAPWLGVNEDPVTGAAHTVLGPYWSGLLGKERLRAFQASRRGGELVVEMAGEGRVYLVGKAVVLMKGELLI